MVNHNYNTRYKNNFDQEEFSKLLYEKFPSTYTLNKLNNINKNNSEIKKYYFNKLKRNSLTFSKQNKRKKFKSDNSFNEKKSFNIHLPYNKDEEDEEDDEDEEEEDEEDEEEDKEEDDEDDEDEEEEEENEDEYDNKIIKIYKTKKDDKDKDLLNKYKKILKDENNSIKYFKTLNRNDKESLIGRINDLNSKSSISIPYEVHLLNLNIEEKYKIAIFNKIKNLNNLSNDNSSTEYIKLKNWIELFTKIPFNNYVNLPITINDGFNKCKEFILESQKILDKSTYGLHDAKIQIMQFIAQIINNPNSNGIVIGIKGPMGTGKTTLVKDGISKILNRPFVFLPLAGIQDGSYLDGHSYTYEGSKHGKIVDILIQSKVMNPIIYGDELDKISGTSKGDEIIGILTHLTDTTQSSEFNDKYFSEINFNLNRVIYIFSYNDDSLISPILRDRMYKIETTGYSIEDKVIISKKYLIPKIIEEINNDIDINITDEAIKFIINNYTNEEKGVRNLKRSLETIYRKLNLYKYVYDDVNYKNNYFIV
jgi:ATP-dependent Lon protease